MQFCYYTYPTIIKLGHKDTDFLLFFQIFVTKTGLEGRFLNELSAMFHYKNYIPQMNKCFF